MAAAPSGHGESLGHVGGHLTCVVRHAHACAGFGEGRSARVRQGGIAEAAFYQEAAKHEAGRHSSEYRGKLPRLAGGQGEDAFGNARRQRAAARA